MNSGTHNRVSHSRHAKIALLAVYALAGVGRAEDVSPQAFLQWFESSYDTIEECTADAFMAGYGAVWLPPPGRADLSDFSSGYDVYDRFDLGRARKETLYGTETGLRTVANTLHSAGLDLHIDAIINHNGFSDAGTTGFLDAGGYPGFVLRNPNGTPTGQPGTDGDFNSSYDYGDLQMRLAGLIDIDHGTNYRFIRNPVPGYGPVPGDHGGNLPAGTTPDGAGRLANVPLESNRQFYPDRDGPSISIYDPKTGETNIQVYSFNAANPMAGDPVGENATGYLMRYLQWMVQDIGVDGFRIDAAKHVEGFTFNYLDRAVYRSNPRLLLDGSTKNVFSYSEVFDTNRQYLMWGGDGAPDGGAGDPSQDDYYRKDIDPNDIGKVGGNRDLLDFSLFYALRGNLNSTGISNAWSNVKNSSLDVYDDGAINGSAGVKFVQSHDEGSPGALDNLAYAYTLLTPGNAVVYFNAKEHGDDRDFPKSGRGDALGGTYGDTVTTLLNIRNTHGRGDYRERWLDSEGTYVFERSNSMLVGLSNRGDAGYDTRWVDSDFDPGAILVELTGNHNDPNVDPAAYNDIPETLRVQNDRRVEMRIPRNVNPDNQYHANGYVVYGLASPRSQDGLELSSDEPINVIGSPTVAGSADYVNGKKRLTDLHVVTSDSLTLRLETQKVTLPAPLGETNPVHDHDADGDNALFKVDGGLDLNHVAGVDYVSPGGVAYGFEEFQSKTPGYTSIDGNGAYQQTIDTTELSEGYHYLTARAFRHRAAGPAVYSDFKKVIYVDRLAPIAGFAGFEPFPSNGDGDDRDLFIRSLDLTADSVHVFLDQPANLDDSHFKTLADQGQGTTSQVDRDLFVYGFGDLSSGNHVVTVVTYEITGNYNVQRLVGLGELTTRGMGVGDLNFDNVFSPTDIFGSGGFEQYLYSQNAQFNPAADVNADGLVDNRDLFDLGSVYVSEGASQATLDEYAMALLRRGNMNLFGGTDAFDIDFLYNQFGSATWHYDLNVDGVASQLDVDALVQSIFGTEYGDTDLDGDVDLNDLSSLAGNYGQIGQGWSHGDFDGDGDVDLNDLGVLAANYGAGQAQAFADFQNLAAVPEPGVMSLLGTGLLLLGRRSFGR